MCHVISPLCCHVMYTCLYFFDPWHLPPRAAGRTPVLVRGGRKRKPTSEHRTPWPSTKHQAAAAPQHTQRHVRTTPHHTVPWHSHTTPHPQQPRRKLQITNCRRSQTKKKLSKHHPPRPSTKQQPNNTHKGMEAPHHHTQHRQPLTTAQATNYKLRTTIDHRSQTTKTKLSKLHIPRPSTKQQPHITHKGMEAPQATHTNTARTTNRIHTTHEHTQSHNRTTTNHRTTTRPRKHTEKMLQCHDQRMPALNTQTHTHATHQLSAR